MPLPQMAGVTLGSAVWWKEQELGTRRAALLGLALLVFVNMSPASFISFFLVTHLAQETCAVP